MKHLFIFVSFLSLFFTFTINAQETTTTTTIEKKVVVTPAPKSVSCNTVNAHWEGNVWFDTQTICRYENRPEGMAWVQDYWACTAATDQGVCTTWEYRPGHWIKTMAQ